MSIGAPFANQTWSREPRTGFDGQGSPQYGAAANLAVRALEGNRLQRQPEGEDVDIRYTLTAAGDSINEGDRMTPPGGTSPDDSLIVMRVQKPTSPAGAVMQSIAGVG